MANGNRKLLALVQAAMTIIGLAVWAKLTMAYADIGSDFNQDYFAALAWWKGLSIYGPSVTSLSTQVAGVSGVENFHPPTSFLFYLPLLFTPYRIAFALWNSLGLLLYWRLVGQALARSGVSQNLSGWVKALCFFWYPFIFCAGLGQSSLLIAVLIAESCWALEDQKPIRSGIALGLAILVKPFPAILAFYFIFKREWRALFFCCGAFALGNLLTLFLTGSAAFWQYVAVIAKRDVAEYAIFPINFSLWSFWRMLFLPNNWTKPLINSLEFANWGIALSCLLVIIYLARVAARARRAQLSDSALYYSLLCAMFILTPIMWSHMLVALVLLLAPWLRAVELKQAALWPFLLVVLLTNHYDTAFVSWLASHYQGVGIPWYELPLLKLNLVAAFIALAYCPRIPTLGQS